MFIKIDRAFPDHMPMNVLRSRNPSRTKYPFAELGIGDSFYVFRVDAKPENVRAAASSFARNRHIKLKCETDVEGIRIKRVE